MIAQVNEWVVEAASSSSDEEDPPDDDHGGPSANSQEGRDQDAAPSDRPQYHQGKLLMDTTCTPADIAYPTDLKLLNNAREKLEAIIDTMHEERPDGSVKPRTYRNKARKQYLAVAKKRRPGAKKRRSAIRQQLHHVRRDLDHVAALAEETTLMPLSTKQYRDLLVIQELYRQQQTMFVSKRRRIDHRIVSIAQPHVRPMVRGKAHAAVEFGAKMSVVVTNGWTHLDRLEWDAYHDAEDLPRAVEAYYDRHGHYPEAVLADQLYRTRENRRFCQERKIRLSGPKLGRPSKETKEAANHQAYQDACERNAVEGKFGEGKRSYGLGRIQARRQDTSETVISLQILNLNLAKALRDLPAWCVVILRKRMKDSRSMMFPFQQLFLFKKPVIQ